MKEPVGLMSSMENLEKWVHKPEYLMQGGHHRPLLDLGVINIFDFWATVIVTQNYDHDVVLKSMLNQVMPEDRGHE